VGVGVNAMLCLGEKKNGYNHSASHPAEQVQDTIAKVPGVADVDISFEEKQAGKALNAKVRQAYADFGALAAELGIEASRPPPTKRAYVGRCAASRSQSCLPSVHCE